MGTFIEFHERKNKNQINAVNRKGIFVENRFWVNTLAVGVHLWVLMDKNDERVYNNDAVTNIVWIKYNLLKLLQI